MRIDRPINTKIVYVGFLKLKRPLGMVLLDIRFNWVVEDTLDFVDNMDGVNK